MTRMTRPLRSTGITPLRRYYGTVRPYLAYWFFGLWLGAAALTCIDLPVPETA